MKIKILTLSLFLASVFTITLLVFTKESVYHFKIKNSLNLSLKQNGYVLPKFCEKRTWEIDLGRNFIYFFENCRLKESIPITYQSPPDKWYQTPTGYYRLGLKREKHLSSLFPVRMDYAVQLYEDYFIHEIPYYLNGQRVSSTFSGGCIRLETKDAKKFFNLAQPGDFVVSYLSLENLKLKKGFVFPVNKDEFFIKQRFNNPLRTSWLHSGDLENLKHDYIQHSGVDLVPEPTATDLNIYNVYDGEIVKITINGQADHGFGNALIVKHFIDGKEIYFLYGHLDSLAKDLKIGALVKTGQVLGKVGATGYGCNYWRIGNDSCQSDKRLDIHLHFEAKTKPTLESPVKATCFVNGRYTDCYGYAPTNPENYGYFNPLKILADNIK